jgi:hypothetical protein
MPTYRATVTVKRNGRYQPPGTPLVLTEDEAKAIGYSRLVKLSDDAVTVVAPIADPILESIGGNAGDAPPPVVVPPATEQAGGASKLISDIAAAIDLLDEAKDFFKSGARKGKPKQKPVEEIVGANITDDDIDAALALRETGLGL